MRKVAIVQMMTWELIRGYQLLSQTLKEMSKEEAQWNPSPNSRTLETLRQWNRKGNK
ncbi:MAG: hypothetical protein ACFFAE_15410 [Candidatus Hodarchaeota archaeon]